MKMWLPASFGIMNSSLLVFLVFIHRLCMFYFKFVVIIRPCDGVIFFSPTEIVFVPSVPLLQPEFLPITSVFVPLLSFIKNNRH